MATEQYKTGRMISYTIKGEPSIVVIKLKHENGAISEVAKFPCRPGEEEATEIHGLEIVAEIYREAGYKIEAYTQENDRKDRAEKLKNSWLVNASGKWVSSVTGSTSPMIQDAVRFSKADADKYVAGVSIGVKAIPFKEAALEFVSLSYPEPCAARELMFAGLFGVYISDLD